MFKYITTLAAAITPLMYFHGAVFHESYLRTLGAPPDLFQLPFEDILVQGFTAYMLLGIPALLLLLLYLLVALCAAYNLNEVSKISLVKRIVVWIAQQTRGLNISDNTQGHHFTEKTMQWISYSLIGVLVLLILLGVTLGLTIQSEKLGKESANTNIKNPALNYKLQELYLSSGTLVKGYIFACSSYGCVVYANRKIQVIRLDSIESIDALITPNSK